MTIADAATNDSADALTVDSVLFGPLTVPPDATVEFRHGLFGFAGPQRFVLLPAQDGVYWLQDVAGAATVFLVVDPFAYIPGYEFQLSPAEQTATGIADTTQTAVLAIVTLPRGRAAPATVNLQGPLLVDFATRQGWQLIQPESKHGTREPIDLSTGAATSSS